MAQQLSNAHWIVTAADLHALRGRIEQEIIDRETQAYRDGLRDSNGKGKAKNARSVQSPNAHPMLQDIFPGLG